MNVECKPDPWGLSTQQAAALAAYIETGCHKRTADRLGICKQTLSVHLSRAREKMQARTVLMALVQWDRYQRGDRDSKWGVAV
jgi:DNA-binding NarL/FixJ family response regulator